MSLPAPRDLGLPKKFARWRVNQPRAIFDIDEAPERIVVMLAPTGFGKTATYMGLSALMSLRVLVLTATRSLQDQISKEMRKFAYDIRGQSNYRCQMMPVSVDQGPCHVGYSCDLKNMGCSYFDRQRDAKDRMRVVSNYQYWFHDAQKKSLGEFDLIVMDEAHAAFDELSRFLSIRITSHESQELLQSEPPAHGWDEWARRQRHVATGRLEELQGMDGLRDNQRDYGRAQQLRNLSAKLLRLSQADTDEWLLEKRAHFGGTAHEFQCVWPGRYAKELLFRGSGKFLLTSATVTPKTLNLLGVKPQRYRMLQYPSTFPVARRPIYVYKHAPRIVWGASDTDLLHWVSLMDGFINRRKDRKGIIHTVSYDRAQLIASNSRHRARMILNSSSDTLPLKLKEFAEAPPGAILVSPSLTEGVDFPYSACEYIIIAKVPFPHMKSKVLQARQKRDPQYRSYVTMMDLVQSAGRAMRAADDQCEVLICDDMFGWFYRYNKGYAPRWFQEALRWVDVMPAPLKKLPERVLTSG